MDADQGNRSVDVFISFSSGKGCGERLGEKGDIAAYGGITLSSGA